MCGQGLCVVHFSLPNRGARASPRGNDLPASFARTIILHLDTLLKSFNYHYFALSLWSHCDPLFRVFRVSAFHLLSGDRSGDFLRDLGSAASGTQTSEGNQQAFGGAVECQLGSIFAESLMTPIHCLPALWLLWFCKHLKIITALGFGFSPPDALSPKGSLPNQFVQMIAVRAAGLH